MREKDPIRICADRAFFPWKYFFHNDQIDASYRPSYLRRDCSQSLFLRRAVIEFRGGKKATRRKVRRDGSSLLAVAKKKKNKSTNHRASEIDDGIIGALSKSDKLPRLRFCHSDKIK